MQWSEEALRLYVLLVVLFPYSPAGLRLAQKVLSFSSWSAIDGIPAFASALKFALGSAGLLNFITLG